MKYIKMYSNYDESIVVKSPEIWQRTIGISDTGDIFVPSLYFIRYEQFQELIMSNYQWVLYAGVPFVSLQEIKQLKSNQIDNFDEFEKIAIQYSQEVIKNLH